ncbi:class I SAM-dependent DNA methyltransferase [Parasphingorhabdus cellanae]|uniref:Class I SAM-dependent methyltransferase n=1 Tax=Parasphingorhabdus cellanae TaxID=2806553 RepID=A0ABX7T2T1_9SPHN|nr:class I SAM-dependent methyltransferase [Parasphingorhabdus cellanae]QTD54857.1 class I SAM-dependent methyltransferase [Parasphingorhabdus cellanae]
MSVFQTIYANQYDTLYTEKDYKGECDLIEQVATKFGSRPDSILDVGCGTGSHVMEMASRGYNCAGVDISQDMLSVAEKKSADSILTNKPKWIVGDARDFDANGHYDMVTMMFAVVSYLTTNDDLLAGLKNIRRHLKPGALFMCDFWYGPAVLAVRPNERVRVLETPKGQTIRAASTHVDSFHHTADVSFRLWNIENGQFSGETQETHRMRYFFPQEFKMMLKACGFESISMSAFPDMDSVLTDDSWNALSIARAA